MDDTGGAARASATRQPTADEIEKAKKWALIHFREMLRGVRLTEQMTRWLSGELPAYRFNVEIALDDKAKRFITDPKNAEKLGKETLI